MNRAVLSLLLVLPLATASLAAQASHPGPTTLDRVTSPSPGTLVRVDCDNAMWPTLRQVRRYTGRADDGAAPVRQYILDQGRRACAQGATHVELQFAPAPRAVAYFGNAAAR